jgi:hypothetical protein
MRGRQQLLCRVKEEDVGNSVGPLRTNTVINIDNDSSSFDLDDDYVLGLIMSK